MTQEPEACRQGLHTKGCLDSMVGQVVAGSQGKEKNTRPLGIKFKLYWEAEKNPWIRLDLHIYEREGSVFSPKVNPTRFKSKSWWAFLGGTQETDSRILFWWNSKRGEIGTESCLPQNPYVEVLTPSAAEWDPYLYRVFMEVIKSKWDHSSGS